MGPRREKIVDFNKIADRAKSDGASLGDEPCGGKLKFILLPCTEGEILTFLKINVIL